MKKYTFVFSVAYFLFAIGVAAVAQLFNLKGGAGLGIAATFAASFLAAWKFTKDHDREPTPEEKKTYAWQALVSVWAVSIVLAAGVLAIFLSTNETKALLSVMVSKTFLLIFAGGALFISVIYYIAIRWSFAWYAKLSCKPPRAA